MPAGTTTMGNPISAATVPTIAWEPSPPAMPRTSTPLAATSRTTCSQSWPGSSTTGRMPRLVHSSTRWNRSALPPPDLRFMNRTPRVAAGTGVPSVSLCLSAPDRGAQCVLREGDGDDERDDAHDDRDDAIALCVDHADDQRDDSGQGHDHGDRPTRLRRGERHPGACDGHDDEEELAHDGAAARWRPAPPWPRPRRRPAGWRRSPPAAVGRRPWTPGPSRRGVYETAFARWPIGAIAGAQGHERDPHASVRPRRSLLEMSLFSRVP